MPIALRTVFFCMQHTLPNTLRYLPARKRIAVSAFIEKTRLELIPATPKQQFLISLGYNPPSLISKYAAQHKIKELLDQRTHTLKAT